MILIVDDKYENLLALKKSLELYNLNIDTALSGEEALKKILKNAYELIILDVQMPGMDGFEVAEAISGSSKTCDIPIIFLSAVRIDKQFITKGYASGGRDYLIKPVDPDILIMKIRSLIKVFKQTSDLNIIQKDLEKEIEFRKDAEQKKDDFFSMASHELKTPLTSLKGYLQMSEGSLEKDQKENIKTYLQRSQKQANKLNALINDLLDIAKMGKGELHFTDGVHELAPIIDSAVDIIRQTYPGHKIIETGFKEMTFFGDPLRIEQVILNYFINAIKYAPNSDTIYLDVSLVNNEAVIKVRDTGIGIPKEKQVHLFDKFYRVEESSNHFQGLGMGLYICSGIIKHHSGSYGVESEIDKGSVFYFTLPIYQATDLSPK